MPKSSSKILQNGSSVSRSNTTSHSQHAQNGGNVVVMRNGGSSGTGGRNHTGQSPLPSSPNNRG